MDSRCRQHSIAFNHIQPLPIPHGLEYPIGSRMYLFVVHLRLEARRRPFPRSPRCRSRVNLRVLRPLTRGPQGQPSPLRTPHVRPAVKNIFPTSRGQVPHGWPTVPHSIATGFPFPQGCCLALSVAQFPLLRFVRNSAMSCSLLPHPFTAPVPAPHPSSRVHSPPGRQQPRGAGPPHMILNLISSHNSVSSHFRKQHGNLYMTWKCFHEDPPYFGGAEFKNDALGVQKIDFWVLFQ